MKKTATLSLLFFGSVLVAQTYAQTMSEDLAWDAFESLQGDFGCGEGGEDHWDDCWDEHTLCHDHGGHMDCLDAVAHQTQILQASGASAVIIPAVLQVTNSTITSAAEEHTEGFECQRQEEDQDFHVSGLLTTNRYECAQEQETMNSCWQQDGTEEAEFCHASPTNCKVHCGCKALHAGADDDLTSTECSCFHKIGDHHSGIDGDLNAGCVDPEDDIERRINEQIYHAIGDILSDAINRCISTSLEGCIEID